MNVGDWVLNYAQSFGFMKLPFTILTPSIVQCEKAELLKLKFIDKESLPSQTNLLVTCGGNTWTPSNYLQE
jgi:hypothetical protein